MVKVTRTYTIKKTSTSLFVFIAKNHIKIKFGPSEKFSKNKQVIAVLPQTKETDWSPNVSLLPFLLKFYCCRREALYHVPNYHSSRQGWHETLSQKTIPKYNCLNPCIHQVYAKCTIPPDQTMCWCSIVRLLCFKTNVHLL